MGKKKNVSIEKLVKLLTGDKKVSLIGKYHYETSLVLSEHNNTYHVLTLKNILQEESSSRYHRDLIINSYASLFEALDNNSFGI